MCLLFSDGLDIKNRTDETRRNTYIPQNIKILQQSCCVCMSVLIYFVCVVQEVEEEEEGGFDVGEGS